MKPISTEEILAKFGGVGPNTKSAAQRLYQGQQLNLDLFESETSDNMLTVALTMLNQKWEDDEGAKVLDRIRIRSESGRVINLLHLNRWLLAHKNAADAVIDCINIDAPDETEILRVLSRAGSQKVVFLATWKVGQQEVVLKQIIGLNSDAIYARESVPHPLSITHDNIIETHQIKNADGKKFLLEKRLDLVLNDKWSSEGNHEAANLLFDILSAVCFLHDKGLIHGDIKPDNIGRRRHSYILLDFGICRPRNEFIEHGSATGSLRTRAPELLVGEKIVEPEKADVWALGATVYNALAKRFPLIGTEDSIPRVSMPDDRKEFEARLRARVHDEWDKWVKFDDIASPLKELLAEFLQRNPADRPTSKEAMAKVKNKLSAYLRQPTTSGQFSPIEQFDQFADLFGKPSLIYLLPQNKRHAIGAKLHELLAVSGFNPGQLADMERWIVEMEK